MSTQSQTDNIPTVTISDFQRLVLDAPGPTVVEFMSYGCAHCRVMEPILQQVATMVKPAETIFRVNIGQDQELAESFRVQGTPTFIMFLEGLELARVEGPPPTLSTVLAAVTGPYKRSGDARHRGLRTDTTASHQR